MDFWVLRDDRSVEGPVTKAEMGLRIRQGRLERGRLVCAVGSDAWRPAARWRELEGLFDGNCAVPGFAAGMPAIAGAARTVTTPAGRVVIHSMDHGVASTHGLTAGAAFGDAWKLLRSSWGALVGASALLVLASLAAQLPTFAGAMFADRSGRIPTAIGLGGFGAVLVCQFLLVVPLFAGTVLFGARRLRGEQVAFSSVKAAWNGLGRLFGVTFGLVLISCLAGFAGMVVMMGGGFVATVLGGPTAAIAIAVPVMVALTVLALRMMPALPYVIDPRFAETDGSAIAAAWQATAGHGLRLFGLYLAAMIILVLCSIAFFLPALLFGMPFAIAIAAAVYARLF